MTDTRWQIEFTEGFRKDVLRVNQIAPPGWLDKLESLRAGPFAKNNNLKPLQNVSKGYRYRIGNIRVFYRVLADRKSVLLTCARPRKEAYEDVNQLTDGRAAGRLEELTARKSADARPRARQDESPKIAEQSAALGNGPEQEHEESPVEQLIDKAELHLIDVPESYWDQIVDLTDLSQLDRLKLPESISSRIMDYVTAPGRSQVGRIYQVGAAGSLCGIATQPLSAFLVRLDPVQKFIVDKPLTTGPYMVRGSPGTGKTLINIARLCRVYRERSHEDLFDEGSLRIGFVTFNRALSGAARRMLTTWLGEEPANEIEFRTLDSLVNSLLRDHEHSDRHLCDSNEHVYLARHAIQRLPELDSEESIMKIVDRYGISYLTEEMEAVILDNGVKTEEEYCAIERIGRKTAMQKSDRRAVWRLYETWCEVLAERNRTTFALRRTEALQLIEDGNLRPERYTALFVDELQDLPVVGVRLLEKLVVNPKHLHFAADTAQSIYLKAPRWSDVSPNLRFHRGNSFVLKHSYRMTVQIANAISGLRVQAGNEDRAEGGQIRYVFEGDAPEWIEAPLEEHAKRTLEIIRQTITKSGVSAGQIAVIGPFNRCLDEVISQLQIHDIPFQRVSRNEDLDLEYDRVHVMTAHSAKGLEFPIVIAPWVAEGYYPNGSALRQCTDENERQEEYEKATRLLYVALSRAARFLYMMTDPERPSSLLSQLDRDCWSVKNQQGVE